MPLPFFSKKKKPSITKEKQKELGLSDAKLKELIEAFCFFDKNHDGFISAKELENALRMMGEDPTPEDVDAMIKKADTVSKDGKVEFLEFIALMNKAAETSPQNSEEELRQLFKIIDKDKTGFINKQELKIALGQCGQDLTDEEVSATFLHADVDKDGKISYEEFVNLLLSPEHAGS